MKINIKKSFKNVLFDQVAQQGPRSFCLTTGMAFTSASVRTGNLSGYQSNYRNLEDVARWSPDCHQSREGVVSSWGGSIGHKRVDRCPKQGLFCGPPYPLHTTFLLSHPVSNFFFYVFEKKLGREELVLRILHNKFQHKNITALSISKYFWNSLVQMKLHGSHAQSIFSNCFSSPVSGDQTFGKAQTFIKVQPCRIQKLGGSCSDFSSSLSISTRLTARRDFGKGCRGPRAHLGATEVNNNESNFWEKKSYIF